MANAAVDPERKRSRLTSSMSSMSSVDTILRLPPSPLLTSPTRAPAGHALEEPPARHRPARRSKPVRIFQSMFRSLPVVTVPRCGGILTPAPTAAAASASPARSDSLLSQIISPSTASSGGGGVCASSRRHMTGTLFGCREGRVSLALQENPRCRPALVVELALPTHTLLRELGGTAGARIVLETEKKHVKEHGSSGSGEHGDAAARQHDDDDGWLLHEPIWTMFCNGKRVGYAVRREPTDGDIAVLETLWAVSMGGGVLPGRAGSAAADGELAYMRGCFDHIIGSQDSESLYMLGPHGGDSPELAVFFVRL
ncbi:protein MIZU-KUSSEI 1-like [Triticum dicoccoides]|uniref:protein MIZU-KUSSEI 1-like n=1 Tax=Triticum dicoccoides TaxID=85692 RepID=UPI000E7B62BE|nr:protein MIZU-KUSSEI 1-like [Triticum dicoccoides]